MSSARKKLRDFKEDFLGLNIENNSIIEENPDTEIYFKSIEEKESDSNKIEEFDDVIELGKLPRKKYQANKEIFKNNIRMEES